MKVIRFKDKNQLIQSLNKLRAFIENEARPHLLTIDVDKYDLPNLFESAIQHLESLNEDIISYGFYTTPEIVFSQLNTCILQPVPSNDKIKHNINELLNKVIQLLHYLINIPNNKTIRTASEEVISKELNKEIKQKGQIIEIIEEEEKKEPNSEKVKELNKLLEQKEAKIAKLTAEKTKSEEQKRTEEDWERRINEAYNILSKQTINIEERKNVLDAEYHIFLYTPIILIILLIIWYCKLYGLLVGLEEYTIQSYLQLLPFYIPIPIIAALFWVCIVQKNRASKILVALEEELFHVKYQHGLLLTLNKLAQNPYDGVKRINSTLDILMQNYFHYTEKKKTLAERIQDLESKDVGVKEDFDTFINVLEKLRK